MKLLKNILRLRRPRIEPSIVENGIRRDRTRAYVRGMAELGSKYGGKCLTEAQREQIIHQYETALGGRHNALSMLDDLECGTSRTLPEL